MRRGDNAIRQSLEGEASRDEAFQPFLENREERNWSPIGGVGEIVFVWFRYNHSFGPAEDTRVVTVYQAETVKVYDPCTCHKMRRCRY